MDLDALVARFGQPVDSDGIRAWLDALPSHRLEKPSDGNQYLVCREGGIDLLFHDPEAVAGRRQQRVLACIFLYAEGSDRHAQFAGTLPFGFRFSDDRAALLARRAPVRTWVIGRGRVPVTHPDPDHDTWQSDRIDLTAVYDAGRVLRFQIEPFQPLDEAQEWKAPPTWQDLALAPGGKVQAIRLYQAETGCGLAAAKAAIDAYIASHTP